MPRNQSPHEVPLDGQQSEQIPNVNADGNIEHTLISRGDHNQNRQVNTDGGNYYDGGIHHHHYPKSESTVDNQQIPQQAFEPEMVEIPSGEFLMGSEPRDGVPDYETPQHLVDLPTYQIGKFPITNQQYEFFLNDNEEVEPPASWIGKKSPTGKEYHPVVNVSWFDAVKYCRWLHEKTGRAYRLPTEAEWEKAARGTDGRLYTWSELEWEPAASHIDAQDTTSLFAIDDTKQPAREKGRSPYGCHDMLGNAEEWTSTQWGKNPLKNCFPYPFKQDTRQEQNNIPTAVYAFLICRGGSFTSNQIEIRCSARTFDAPHSKVSWRGFRIVRGDIG